MDATITARTTTSFTLQVEVHYNDSMLDFEEALQRCLNEAGVLATAEGLKQFDTDGSPITVGPVKFTRGEQRGQEPFCARTTAPDPLDPSDFHAELTAIDTAGNRGVLPTRGVTTNKVCKGDQYSLYEHEQMSDLSGQGNYDIVLSPDGKSFEFVKQ